ncbi:DUF2637 domain-containing protein [Streptomyces albogriseolus]|uniref:DUF2637 domain-containing protein n=1 Tax=Streptomyces albogriseolus TaxID=1887 RepID=UPI003460FC01
MKRLTARHWLAVGAAAFTVALTAVAFWLSYEHLHDVAAANGLGARGSTARAWAWPATVDMFIIVGELLILRASLRGTVDPWAIALAALGSIGSIALNVAGVGADASPLEYVVAAVPPVAALLAFGALMRQVHEAIAGHVEEPSVSVAEPERTLVPATPPPVVVAAALTPRLTGAAPAKPAATHEKTAVAEARPRVALLSVADVAKAKGVAEGTVRSWVARNKLSPAQRDGNRLLFHPQTVASLD